MRWGWKKEGPSVQEFKASLSNMVRPCLRRKGRIEKRREGGREEKERRYYEREERGGSTFATSSLSIPHNGHVRWHH